MKFPLVIVDLKLNISMKWVWKCSKNQIQNNHFEMDDPVVQIFGYMRYVSGSNISRILFKFYLSD